MQPTEPADGSVVTRLRRPPVRQSTLVRSDAEHTFHIFVTTIGMWWPVTPFSRGGERVRAVIFEQTAGGRVYETWQDGTRVDWGHVLPWNPPAGFTLSWLITPAATEVELRFTALAPGLTRVSVEHRGWEALNDAQLTEACALPGGYQGGAFNDGWARILSALAAAVEAPAD